MRLAQLRRPLTAAVSSISRPTAGVTIRQLQDVLGQLRIGGSGTAVEGRRHASVKSQGAYKIRDTSTIPKKMGAKKTGDSYVIPGNIIYKQRGTLWFPGENVGMGRDHTLFALATGYVKYYKDPLLHPKRQYIGVVFDKDDTLPYPRHAMRKRKLNMTASVIPPRIEEPVLSASGIPNTIVRPAQNRKPLAREERIYRLKTELSYAYQEEPWRLGTLIRTEKRKMGSRRVVMRRRRLKTKAILQEMRTARGDKITRRQEAFDEQRAAKQRKFNEFFAMKQDGAASKGPGAGAGASQGPKVEA